MNYLVISPFIQKISNHSPLNWQKRRRYGSRYRQEPYDQLPEELRNALTEYFRVENLENLMKSSVQQPSYLQAWSN